MADVLRSVKRGSFLSMTLLRTKSAASVTANRVRPKRRLFMVGKSAYAVRVMPIAVRATLIRSDFLDEGRTKSEE